jgi:argininosuccinate lyase
MTRLWQTSSRKENNPNADFTEAFTVGNDAEYDNLLLPYDIIASKAHANMLAKKGILTAKENARLQNALTEGENARSNGNLTVTADDEDCHTLLENFLTTKCGEVGKKIHTGRSRNDQVLTAMRLLLREHVQEMSTLISSLEKAFRQSAEKWNNVPMPGYTHMQRAMPTTVHMWLQAFGDAIQDQQSFFEPLQTLLDQNPLGSASGFGIRNFTTHRKQTARELGFSRVQDNPISCGLSRGLFEWQVISTLSPILLICSRFMADVLFFTSDGRQYFSLPDFLTTGSSIMPQKRNVDPAEVFRGKTSRFFAKKHEMEMIQCGLLSGYNRDISLIKETYFESYFLAKDLMKMASVFAQELSPNEEALRLAMTEDLFVTEKVYELVKQGTPFRDAYQKVKAEYFHDTKEES